MRLAELIQQRHFASPAQEAVLNISAIIKKFTGRDIANHDIHVQFVGAYEGVSLFCGIGERTREAEELYRELVEACLRRFREGQTAVLVNCAVLTEGFDEPRVDAIIVARPGSPGISTSGA